MKQILILLPLFILHMTMAQGGQNKVETIKIKASINCDHCLQCESCGSRLEKAVYTVKGIKRVDIDESEKTIKVIYNPQKTSVDKIRAAIARVGFDADDVKGDPEAYNRLDECCKKQD